ncbi:MAG TPA: hypothetical protein VLC93_06970, partial [Myxococcota bacterium]|nr:hypothetical protein [Myxococcota bacterium]
EAQSPWSATHVFLVNTTVEPSAPDAPDPVDEEPAAPPTPRDQGCNAAGSDAVALLLGYAMLRAALVREQHRRRQAPVGGVA